MTRFCRHVLMLGIAVASFLVGAQQPGTGTEVIYEVVVTGRRPGPPLWKISSGEHVLWILPLVDMYPARMEWDSARVEGIIAESQEYIARPIAQTGIATSNPFLLVRMMNMSRKAAQLPDGEALADVLPPDLYRRLRALKARYFPGNRKIERLGISAAGRIMQQEILDRENLQMLHSSRIDSPIPITSKLRKWLKANKGIRRTTPGSVATHSISSGDVKILSEIFGQASATADFREWEVACLEEAIAYFEKDFEPVKRRANAWAQGRVDDLISPTPLYGGNESCRDPPILPGSIPAVEKLRRDDPELAAFLSEDRTALVKASKEKWLEAAEAALARNASTFGVLAVNDILDEGGLVARLREKGYVVTVSAE